MRKFSKAIIFILLIWLSPASADYQDGLNAYMKGDFSRALSEWRKVTVGSPDLVHPAVYAESHYAIGMLYWKGDGVPQDLVTSSVWLKQAAEMNHRGAQVKLGYLYTAGEGVQQNFIEARKWLEMAAAQGDPDALYNMGVFYRDGLGVLPDERESLKWFRQAAAKGDRVSAQIVAQHDGSRDWANNESFQPTNDGAAYLAKGVDLAEDKDEVELVEVAEPEHFDDFEEQQEVGLTNDIDEQEIEESIAKVVPGRPAESKVEQDRPTPEAPLESSPESLADSIEPELAAYAEKGDSGENWILEQDPDKYTIQVVALRQPEQLHTFMDRYPQLAPFAIYRQLRYENPLWVLIQGDYADVDAARAAVTSFPRDLTKRDKLWIRRFQMVQGLIE